MCRYSDHRPKAKMKSTDAPIVVKELFDCSPEKLWNAISKPVQMRAWFFENMPDFKAEVGFETRFDVTTEEGVVFPHIWKVTEAEPPRKLVVNWTYKGYEGAAEVCFEVLSTAGDDTSSISVTAKALEDFRQDIPEFLRESAVAGWDFLIKERLKSFLDSN